MQSNLDLPEFLMPRNGYPRLYLSAGIAAVEDQGIQSLDMPLSSVQ